MSGILVIVGFVRVMEGDLAAPSGASQGSTAERLCEAIQAPCRVVIGAGCSDGRAFHTWPRVGSWQPQDPGNRQREVESEPPRDR